MDKKEKLLIELRNSKEILNILINTIEKLENRCINGVITYDEAIRLKEKWEMSIQNQYKYIDLLKKQLIEQSKL